MNLIEEIESRSHLDADGEPANMLECMLVNSAYWPRIKAALEAAMEMERGIVGYMLGHMDDLEAEDLCVESAEQFRAEMEGVK